MIAGVDSSVSFRARFDAEASQKLLSSVKNNRILIDCVKKQMDIISDWGDKDSVIRLSKDRFTGRDYFVLQNEYIGGDKKVNLGSPICGKEPSLLVALLEIKKKTILDAEKFLSLD